MRSHPHVKTTFPPGKQSPTVMSTVGSYTAIENHVAIFQGENGCDKNYTDHRGTRLTSIKEMDTRRANSLCYWCPKLYMVGNICKGKKIFLIVEGEGDIAETELEQG